MNAFLCMYVTAYVMHTRKGLGVHTRILIVYSKHSRLHIIKYNYTIFIQYNIRTHLHTRGQCTVYLLLLSCCKRCTKKYKERYRDSGMYIHFL